MKKKYNVFNIPTGVGASIGGFAGDAGSYARKFAKNFPLIVNPNVVNAACFSSITDNMLYVEGWSLTEFFKGNISFKPSFNNKIGIIFDKSISQEVLNIHINTINAVKTVYGINVLGYIISDDEVGVEFFKTESGISLGNIKNPETLVEAGKKMIAQGADVLAVVCKFEEAEDDGYENGENVDVVGGAEALISHYVSQKLYVPVVHAPAFNDYAIKSKIVHPKAAAEYITPTFLPCLLLGLNSAPLLKKGFNKNFITIDDVKSLIMPYNSLGASIVTNALEKGIKVIAVKENQTVLNANVFNLQLENDIILMDSYKDCLEYLKRL
ncbi:DUF3326 domain-containing protein [bacterium]|nr:DUF3326 domain-containing protein [bacterium]